MREIELKYGNNPNQKPAKIFMADGSDLPLKVLNGRPGYINLLDGLNAWQLVKELTEATGLAAACSFKHVSPTSAALGRKLNNGLKKACFVENIEGIDESPLASAYARARGTDRLSSFGDFIGLSQRCDAVTARLIKQEVSDGVIAPDYTAEALEILKSKRKGNYLVMQMDPDYKPAEIETKQVFGISFSQKRNDVKLDYSVLENIVTKNKDLDLAHKQDLVLGLITLKYTQSNSVCYCYDGQAIGVGAGQQSRIHCTRLAGDKADTWFLRQHPLVLSLPFKAELSRAERDNAIDAYINHNEEDILQEGLWQKYFIEKPDRLTKSMKKAYLSALSGVSLCSDAFFPFSDNIKRAVQSGVSYVVQPGGSIRDDLVIAECDKHNLVMVFNQIRLFHH